MKKILLGSTALAAVTFAATAASAQSLEDRVRTLEESMLMGSPGSGFDVVVSGYTHAGFFLVDSDPTADRVDYAGTNVEMGAGEIHFTGTGTLDNGIEVGARVELEGHTQTDQIDETYIWAEGGFGRVVLGSENGAAYLMHYSAPWIAGVNGVDSPNYRGTAVTGARTNTQTLIAGDSNKITYFTPRFSGFQFGISYSPDNVDRGGQQRGYGLLTLDRGGHIENVVAVAGNFTRDLGDFSFGASAGWESGAATDEAQSEDPSNWHIGGEVSAQGFTLGGAYYRADGFMGGAGTAYKLCTRPGSEVGLDDNNMPAAVPTGDAYCTGGTGGNVSDADLDLSDELEQTAWAVGASYGTGPWNFGVAFLQSEGKNHPQTAYNDAGDAVTAIAAEGEPETRVIELAASYQVGPGVSLALDVNFYEDDLDKHANDPAAKYSKVESTTAGLILGVSF